MPKFSGAGTRTAPPLAPTATTAPTGTHEGGAGFAQDAKTELYTLAVTNMVSETTFYESAGDRDDRFRRLVHQVTKQDPTWVAGFVPWLRNEANMRSAAVVVACEYVRAGGPHGRAVVSAACQRADEPAEVIGYWTSRYGRSLPAAVKRGTADAALRLYTQRSALKYDGTGRGIRMGDVLETCHPNPHRAHLDGDTEGAERRSALFKHLIDRRRGRPVDHDALAAAGLNLLNDTYRLDAVPTDKRRAVLRGEQEPRLAQTGFTWERLAGWLPGGMDAEAWEAIIPQMGVMALIRNLRNFEEAKVSKTVLKQVADRISDPDEVAQSRQFPYRWWSAYKNSGTMFFGPALEQALELSTGNVPEFSGRTLVMVDTSRSMDSPVSARSAVRLHEIAALFAAAVAAKSQVVLCPYADTTYRAQIHTSVLRTIQDIAGQIERVGCGTNTWPSTLKMWGEHGPFDRIVVFTDMQDHPAAADRRLAGSRTWDGSVTNGLIVPRAARLPDVPVHVWDLRGYGKANIDTNTRGRYLFSGFSDTAFRLIGLLESGANATWPWL